MELTKEQVEQLLKDQKQLGDYLKTLTEKNGNAAGTPKADAIEMDTMKKMTDGLLEAMESKGLFKKERKFVWGGKKEAMQGNEVAIPFGKYLLMAKANHPEITEQYMKLVMNETTSAQGGYTVPTEYANEIIGAIYDGATIIPKCTRYPQGSPTKNMPKWLTGISVSWVDEDAEKALTKPTLTYKQSVLKKMAVIVPFTDEYLADDTGNIVTGVYNLVKEAFENEIERVALVGDVTGLTDPFNGIAYSATGGNIVNQAGLNLSYGDVISCWNNASVLEKYRLSQEWYMNRNALGLVMNIVDLNNQPIFKIVSGEGKITMTLLGFPLNLSPNILSTYGNSGAETKIIFGDYRYMLLGEKAGDNGLQVAVSNSAVEGCGASDYVGINAFKQDETWYRFVMRRGILCAIPEAYSVLNKVI